MGALPLHPALVHLPLGLAVLAPLLVAGLGWAVWTERLPRAAWLVVVLMTVAMAGGGYAAMLTGQDEEEVVEDVVPEAAIHEHEERAEMFVWAAGVTAVLALLGAALKPRGARRAAIAATFVGTLAVAGLGWATGEAGGELVYVHGAASAHTSPGQAGEAAGAAESSGGGEVGEGRGGGGGDDDDDDDDD